MNSPQSLAPSVELCYQWMAFTMTAVDGTPWGCIVALDCSDLSTTDLTTTIVSHELMQ